jgi:hypothetical protein
LPRSFDARLPDDGSIAAARRRPDIWAEAAALPYRYWPEISTAVPFFIVGSRGLSPHHFYFRRRRRATPYQKNFQD